MEDNKDNPTVAVEAKPKKGSQRKGKQSKAKSEQAFRVKKNSVFQAELSSSIMKRLHISDPVDLSAIQLQSAITPARIPITLRGLPRYTREVWSRMVAVGTSAFRNVSNTPNAYAIFLKCCLIIAESRVTYAQMKCESFPCFPMTSISKFSEMQLRSIRLYSSRLPVPLAIFMEAIGNITIDSQTIVPVEANMKVEAVTGAVSFFPTSIFRMMEALRTPTETSNAIVEMARLLNELPNFGWNINNVICPAQVAASPDTIVPERSIEVATLTGATYDFWKMPTPSDWSLFSQIIACFESKPGFLILFDVTSGIGANCQLVRFPEAYDPDEEETQYYMNVVVSEFDEKIAPAFMLGLDEHLECSSRYISNYQECLKHGNASQANARHALIWSTH